jgi:hypothetical protein
MQQLQTLANGGNRASVVSADGSVIGGFAQGSQSRTPAVWDDTLAGELLDPPDGFAVGEIQGISDDGTILLGTWTTTNPVALATKWTWNGSGWDRATIESGALLAGWTGVPMDIADDDTIVGFDFLLGNRRAWIQPHGTGPLVELISYIESHGGDVPAGLPLHVCQAISTDGRYIIGHGAGPGADDQFSADGRFRRRRRRRSGGLRKSLAVFRRVAESAGAGLPGRRRRRPG